MKTISTEDYLQASIELGEAVAVKRLLKNNDLGAEIHAAYYKVGICENKFLLPAINKQIKELKKFLKGKKNSWQ